MNNLKEYIRKQVNKQIINELFDNSITIDNEIELTDNSRDRVAFKYIEPNTKDIYEFYFVRHNYDKEQNMFGFAFSKNDDYKLTKDNIQFKIFSVLNNCVKKFLELKPNTDIITYSIDSNELKRRKIYNAIFYKYGFKETNSSLKFGDSLYVTLKKNVVNKNTLNELFDGNLSLDNEIEVITNNNFKTEFHYIEPNSNDIYEFVFMKESTNFSGKEYRFLFSKNDDYGLSNDNIQYKILTVMYKCIGMFLKFKPNVSIISYSIDEDELKRKNVYNAIFYKYGFKETNTYKTDAKNYSFNVKLEKI